MHLRVFVLLSLITDKKFNRNIEIKSFVIKEHSLITFGRCQMHICILEI